MKFQFKNIAAFVAVAVLFTSCNNDDDTPAITDGTTGDVELFFDNGVAGDALILGNAYTNSNAEKLTINRLNYIVSNFVLIAEDGTEYVYPKESSYFIVSQENKMQIINLTNIPVGNYKKIKFGIGVDQQRYLQGETAQQSFWDLAAANHLGQAWSTGYRFINFEGTFTSTVQTMHDGHDHGDGGEGEEGETHGLKFQVYQGSSTATDNYREVTLDLPTTARVRTGEKPNIHFKTDVNVLLDGKHKIVLQDNLNQARTEATITDGDNLIKIAENSLKMIVVDHVHNGAGNHH